MGRSTAFHPGEIEVQRRLGVARTADARGRQMLGRSLHPDQAAFLGGLDYVALSARDDRGRPWATLLRGTPGFAQAKSPQRLCLMAGVEANDPLAGAFRSAPDVGLLAIEPSSGRRLRLNGRARQAGGALEIQLKQVFANCRRQAALPTLAPGMESPDRSSLRSLAGTDAACVACSSAFLLATGYGRSLESASLGMDVSYRGGEPGFVTLDGASGLGFPDYPGNDLFSSIGNLVKDPRAGLLFFDFERGALLHLTGEIRIEWPRDGAPGRRLHFRLGEGVRREGAIRIAEGEEVHIAAPSHRCTATERAPRT